MDVIRSQLDVHDGTPLVLVTPGGGKDGYPLAQAYLHGMGAETVRSVVVAGPEMAFEQRQAIRRLADPFPAVTVLDSTDASQ